MYKLIYHLLGGFFMLMVKLSIPLFRLGEEYELHEFDLNPLGCFLAENNFAYELYRYRKIRKYQIYLFYNCDILSAFCVFDNKENLIKIKTKRNFKKEMVLKIITKFKE
ncbi:hypothetical protein DI487_04820 [Flavobacterium sediminis]|uniref:Uncharacterized protein n=1 Tax=Flavobacterium sediminis TaxID=2201181 RepID=A0A2U8QSX1_9FLAO|nr:hypothetical protein [Flavobacterium sediminis]AWM13253.1 hypothetical protein DI487_04820 [Flavobacterium sediminis]